MALRRSAIPRLRLTATGFEIETQIVSHALRAGLKVAEVPSFEAARRSGGSNLRTFPDGGRVLRELIRARARSWPREPAPPALPADLSPAVRGVVEALEQTG